MHERHWTGLEAQWKNVGIIDNKFWRPAVRTLISRTVVSVLALAVAGCTHPRPDTEAGLEPRELFAIYNVNLIPMSANHVIEDQVVLVSDGRIVAIRPNESRQTWPDVVAVDGEDGYLLPGLADMHVHLGLKLPQDGPASIEGMERDLSLYLPNGVTTIRHMRGDETALSLRDEVASGRSVGPRLIVAGPSLTFDAPAELGLNIRSPAEAAAAVTAQIEAGYDLIKIHQPLPGEVFEAATAAASSAGLKTAGHAQGSSSQSFKLGSLEHVEEIAGLLGDAQDFTSDPQLLNELKASGVTVTPTLVVFDAIHRYLTDDDLEEFLTNEDSQYASSYWRGVMSPEANFFRQAFGPEYEKEAAYFETESAGFQLLVQQLHAAGVPLMLGTDAVGLVPPGVSVHQELEMLVEAGLSPFEALYTATVEPAIWMEEAHERGRLETGMVADFVLLSQNPLTDIRATRTIEGVYTGGQWYERDELEHMIAD